MGFWRIVLTIILPPLGVLLGKGFGWAFILGTNARLTNIIMTAQRRRLFFQVFCICILFYFYGVSRPF